MTLDTATRPNTPLLTAQATDADTLFFSNIKYSLVGDETAARFFRIDPSSGVVSLKADVATEQDAVYRLVALRAGKIYNVR